MTAIVVNYINKLNGNESINKFTNERNYVDAIS